jgi:hypothetical protein
MCSAYLTPCSGVVPGKQINLKVTKMYLIISNKTKSKVTESTLN